MTVTRKIKLTAAAAGAATVAAGAVAGISGASASSAPKKAPAASAPRPASQWFSPRRRGLERGGLGRAGLGPAVHEQAVVLNRAGTAFITATIDNGTLVSVSGDQLTLKEGTAKVPYKTVTLTIPTGATILRDFARVALDALKPGDRVRVVQSSDGTSVLAFDLSQMPWRHGPPSGGPHGVPAPPTGPGGPAGPGAPPPMPGA